MRFVVRKDMGGFAASLRAAALVAKVDIDRPFVWFAGPPGAGKTALLRMARAAMGLEGIRGGTIDLSPEWRPHGPADAAVCGDDLARLAAARQVARRGGRSVAGAVPDNLPGVIDVAALGWVGQRSWLYDGQAETVLAARTSMNSLDGSFQPGHLMENLANERFNKSHGQMLGGLWREAMLFALGHGEHEDPYDDPESLPSARRKFWDVVTGGADRPSERWLFLDTPEEALDTPSLVVGLATLLANAAPGKLRVFCASQSPVFSECLSGHPAIQAVELERGFVDRMKEGFAVARDPARLASVGEISTWRIRDDVDRMLEAGNAAIAKAVRGLAPPARDLLVAALHDDDLKVAARYPDGRPVASATIEALCTRDLVKLRRWNSGDAVLTPQGQRVARWLSSKGPKTADGSSRDESLTTSALR